MKTLMRNTVFKTAVLTGLFSCMLALAGAFSGITASVHAMHGFIHAGEVGTDQERLKEFVEDAVNAYFIDEIVKDCNFKNITNSTVTSLGATNVYDLIVSEFNENDTLADEVAFQAFLDAPAADLRRYVSLFSRVRLTRADMEKGCNFSHRFPKVFDEMGNREEGDWKEGSIYLFVMDDEGTMLFHGDNRDIEGKPLVAEDEGGRNVTKLIIDQADDPSTSNPGIVQYCWEDPGVDDDEITDENGEPIPGTAPGDSWKISYVVDPFVSLGAPALAGSPGIIFGSGIYPDPATGNPPPGCDGNGMADYVGDDMGGDDDMGGGNDMGGSGGAVSGGGCAIVAGSSENAPRSNALNLLLIVSALLFTVSFRSSVMRRRNDINS